LSKNKYRYLKNWGQLKETDVIFGLSSPQLPRNQSLALENIFMLTSDH